MSRPKAWTDLWPVFGLRITAGPVELRGMTDADMPALLALIADGIHPRDRMPFAMPWTDAPPEQLGRNSLAYWWGTRAAFGPEQWTLDLVVRWEGEIVGVQGFATHNYLVTRSGETGSWLGRRHQGHGIGTAMRRAMCAFLFDHLGAQEITSGAFTDNPASLAVSRKIGYRTNGQDRVQRRPGDLAVNQRLVLAPGDFVRDDVPVEVEGAEAMRTFIGL